MSNQTRAVPTQVVVCDLCDGVLKDGDNNLKRASLVHGYGGMPHAEKAKARAWHLRWSPSDWVGRHRPTFEEQRSNEERYRTREYDFHTECLLRLVEDKIAARQEAERG